MNQLNTLHVEEPTEPPRECNSQHPETEFKSMTSPSITIPLVSATMGRINHPSIDFGDVEVHPS